MKNSFASFLVFAFIMFISFPFLTYGSSNGNDKKIYFGIKAGPINSSFRINKSKVSALQLKDSFDFIKNY